MENNDTIGDPSIPERSCILTREAKAKAALIRLALGPDGTIAPDVRAKAPGRGAYIGVDRAALEQAMASGKLKAALARAFKSGAVTIPDDLPEKIERALSRNALDRMGLEARGGTLISGSEKVDKACRSGKARLLLHAADAAEDGRRKLDAGWRVGGGEDFGMSRGVVLPVDRDHLSMALGRENVVHIAVINAAAAKRVHEALARWQAFLEPDAGLDGGKTAGSDASADEDEMKG